MLCYGSLNITSIYLILISATCWYVEMISTYAISNCILSAVIVSLFILHVQQFIKFDNEYNTLFMLKVLALIEKWYDNYRVTLNIV